MEQNKHILTNKVESLTPLFGVRETSLLADRARFPVTSNRTEVPLGFYQVLLLE